MTNLPYQENYHFWCSVKPKHSVFLPSNMFFDQFQFTFTIKIFLQNCWSSWEVETFFMQLLHLGKYMYKKLLQWKKQMLPCQQTACHSLCYERCKWPAQVSKLLGLLFLPLLSVLECITLFTHEFRKMIMESLISKFKKSEREINIPSLEFMCLVTSSPTNTL